MGGLEKIIDRIISNAKETAEANINEARKKALEIEKDAKEKADYLKAQNEQKIIADCDKIKQMAESADRQNLRHSLLKARNDVIKSIIAEAKEHIKSMDGEKYTDILKKLIKNNISNDEGEIIFSKKDLKIVDDKFKEYIKEESRSKLKVSDEIADIESGFIIRYGKIEINCSIDSIFEDKYNELSDLVNSYLSSN